jgi:hypothetical protein
MTTNVTLPQDPRRHITIIRVGGLSLIVAAVAFLGVFSYLADRFRYPDVLDGRAADVLPALLATGNAGRAAWAIYSLLPLFWIPAAVGAFQALRPKSENLMHVGVLFAVVSSGALTAGLMRWPSFHWELARAWAAEPSARPALNAVFNGMNTYLGNYVGEFLGELCFSIFFVLTASAMLKQGSGFSRWIGWLGLATGVAGLAGMFRNVADAVGPVAEANNYLLPLWMIVFGFSLLRFRQGPVVLTVNPAPIAAF